MKKYTYPTKIELKELPIEGRDFHYNRDSGELNSGLEDLIGKNTYEAHLHLQPTGNIYSITGNIQTRLQTQCSRCGRDMKHPVQNTFSELIIVEKPRPRNSESSHFISEDASIYCNYIHSTSFNIEEFIHEHIASSEPYVVECLRNDCEKQVLEAQKKVKAPSEIAKENPFAVLKNFKPKH